MVHTTVWGHWQVPLQRGVIISQSPQGESTLCVVQQITPRDDGMFDVVYLSPQGDLLTRTLSATNYVYYPDDNE